MLHERKYEIGYMISGRLVTEIIYSTLPLAEVQRLWSQKVGSSNFRYVREK